MRKVWVGGKAHSVFLRCDYNFVSTFQTVKRILYVHNIVAAEVMVVGEMHHLCLYVKRLEIFDERTRVCYARDGEHNVFAVHYLQHRHVGRFSRENRSQVVVVIAAEEELLIREEVGVFLLYPEVHRLYVVDLQRVGTGR